MPTDLAAERRFQPELASALAAHRHVPISFPMVTLGDLTDEGIGVWAWCLSCGHTAALPPDTLAARLGRAFPVPKVGVRLKCTACGGKGGIDTRPDYKSTMGVVTRHG